MPIYNFKCKKCGNIEEKLVKYDSTESICNKCKSPSEKTNTIFNLNFKLNGKWFKTTGTY